MPKSENSVIFSPIKLAHSNQALPQKILRSSLKEHPEVLMYNEWYRRCRVHQWMLHAICSVPIDHVQRRLVTKMLFSATWVWYMVLKHLHPSGQALPQAALHSLEDLYLSKAFTGAPVDRKAAMLGKHWHWQSLPSGRTNSWCPCRCQRSRLDCTKIPDKTTRSTESATWKKTQLYKI